MLTSDQLGVLLRVEQGDLVMYDAQSGKRLLTEKEAERAARQAAEAEVERLREQLKRHGLE